MLAGKATDLFDPFNDARDFTIGPSKKPPKSCLTSVKKPLCSPSSSGLSKVGGLPITTV
jgi:hypothetical protein